MIHFTELQRVFSDTYKKETETVYYEDGKIETYPLPYELGDQITANGGSVRFKAAVVVDRDGNTQITPYRSGTGQRYRLLAQTAHGTLLETQEDIYVKMRFRKKLGRLAICDMLEDEADEFSEILETTNEIKEWNEKDNSRKAVVKKAKKSKSNKSNKRANNQ